MRTPLPKSLRFEVLKRDKFSCQYCGAKAPDVLIHVDHITPVAEGGENDLLNLVASCEPCNAGKGARALADSSVVERQRAQIEELQEKREQVEMMLAWKQAVAQLDDDTLAALVARWNELAPGFEPTPAATKSLRRWVRRFGLGDVLDAMKASADQYVEIEEATGNATAESWDKGWEYIGRICGFREKARKDPTLEPLVRLRARARARCSYFNDWQALQMLRDAHSAGVAMADLERLAGSCRNWTDLRTTLERWTEEALAEAAPRSGVVVTDVVPKNPKGARAQWLACECGSPLEILARGRTSVDFMCGAERSHFWRLAFENQARGEHEVAAAFLSDVSEIYRLPAHLRSTASLEDDRSSDE